MNPLVSNLAGYKIEFIAHSVSITFGALLEIMQCAMKVFCTVALLAATTEAIPGKRCPKIQEVDWELEVLLPHRDCDKFYQCTHGEPVEMSCPKGLFYSIIEKVCEWRDLVDCGGRNVPEEKEPGITPGPGGSESVQTEKPVVEFRPNGCPVDPEVHWLLPHEKNCKLFYYCAGDEREVRRCPFGLYFNKKRQVCDWPWNVTCKKTTEQQ